MNDVIGRYVYLEDYARRERFHSQSRSCSWPGRANLLSSLATFFRRLLGAR